MKQLNAGEIREIQLEMLKQFAIYCDENHICYTLSGGTLLGAIRHKGFIPWDDDIDVMMPRPDYMRFIKLQKTKKTLAYTCITDGSGGIPFIKLLALDTKIDTPYSKNEDCDNIWIDVFPIDGLPDSEYKTVKIFKHSIFLRTCFGISRAKLGTGTTKMRALIKIAVAFPIRVVGRFRLAKAIEKYCMRYSWEESNYVGGIVWGYGPQERMPKREWLKRVQVEFEGEKYWAPGCWELYLKNLYGNYMELPPEEKRVSHNLIAWRI